MKRIKFIGIGVLVLLIIIVVLQNTERVDTKLLFFTITMPRALLLAATAAIGFIVGLMSSLKIRRGK